MTFPSSFSFRANVEVPSLEGPQDRESTSGFSSSGIRRYITRRKDRKMNKLRLDTAKDLRSKKTFLIKRGVYHQIE